MEEYSLTPEVLAGYRRYMREEEHAPATIEKYLHDLRAFSHWLEGKAVTKELAADYKSHLLASGYAPVTVNAALAAFNGLFAYLGLDIRMKYLKIQRQVFRDRAKELTRAEYVCLVDTAKTMGKERLALLMEAICATGIRVGEVRYLTVESARQGQAVISMKGKSRVILLPDKLCRKLLKYAKKQKIASGAIFRTGSGKCLSPSQIWREMKNLAKTAGMETQKVYPHNLRHLFARSFYKSCRDIVKLADILGHSTIETTRIYLVTTGDEHQRELDKLGLVS